MLKVIACDDDPYVSIWFKLILAEYSSCQNIEYELNTFVNAKDFIELINAGYKPDIIFLDIMFPESNGISLAKTIRSKIQDSTLVFVTSSDDFAMEGYSVHAYDYLLKPLQKETVFNLLNNLVKTALTKFEIHTRGLLVEIKSMELSYIESNKHDIIFHTQKSELRTYGKLDYYEDLLKNNRSFIRCHQSYLVNMSFIREVKGKDYILMDGTVIPIRKASASECKQRYYSYSLSAERT